MATAEELLSGRSVSGVDKTLVISNDLRTIAIPSSVKNLGVEYDDDVLELNFKMPRYIGPTDLSPFTIRINYMNAQGEPDVYTVKSPTVGTQDITFSWLVGPIATRYKGDTKFNVCLRTFTGSGEDLVVDREYNTTVASLPVLEGLEVDEGYLEDHVDLLEQWRRELFGAGDSAVNAVEEASQKEQENIVKKGAEVLATIPEDYQTTFEMIDNADRTKSDAIVSTVEGEIVTVADSSDDYLRGLRVFGKTTQVKTTGKNLFNPECLINAGWSKHNETYWGTSSLLADVSPEIAFRPNTRYTISTWGHGSSSGDVSIFIYAHYTDGTVVTAVKIAADRTPKYYTYTTDEGKTVDHIRFSYGYNQKSCLWDTMVEEGGSTTVYEPFSNGLVSPSPELPQPLVSIDSAQVIVAGKNLVTNETDRVATILNGVTFTIKKDSSEFIIGGAQDGTRDASGTLAQNILLTPGTYTISVSGLCGTDYINVQRMDGDNGYAVTGVTQKLPKTFTVRDNTRVLIQMVVLATSTYNNIPLTVQLEAASVATEYEPYKVKQSISMTRALSGIPVSSGGNYTDENGQQWVCDEIDFERGVYVQRLYTQTVSFYETAYGDGVRYNANLDHIASSGYDGAVLCDVLPFHKNASIGYRGIRVAVTSPNKAVAWYDNLVLTTATITYILATPIETPLTSDEIQWFKFAHTNFPNTTVLNDAGATMQLKYNVDTKMYLDNVQKPTDDQVQAAVDAWLTANYANAEGAKF